jgi:hypothetical protein
MNEEIEQLLIDIRRIGPTHAHPTPKVLFGELFDDEQVEQYYEALVGTLKCAKKRGIIHFKGQMLLKGIHDNVTITIVEEGVEIDDKEDDVALSVTPRSFTPRVSTTPRTFTPTASWTPKSFTSKAITPSAWSSSSTPRSFTPRSFTPRSFTPTSNAAPPPSSTPRAFSYQKKKKEPKSPIREKPKNEIVGTFSDTEGPPEGEDACATHSMAIASDSEFDIRKSPRRVIVPAIFRSPIAREGLPPRVARSPRWGSKKKIPPRRPLLVKPWSEQDMPNKTNDDDYVDKKKFQPAPTLKLPPKKLVPQRTKSESTFLQPKRSPLQQQSHRSILSTEVASQVQDEVNQLLLDIRRVGANPGEPTVKFGELFDDEVVQNTYEALVGTLRSAKRQGLIDFKGQMLLKGMHDNVEISVVDQ